MKNYLLTLVLLISSVSLSHAGSGFHSRVMPTKWEEYLLSGNGTMGVMVAGVPCSDTIVFNHTNIFLPIYDPLIPPTQGNHLDEIRQLLLEDRYQEASQSLVSLSHADGFGRKRPSDLFVPAFQLILSDEPRPVKDYSRSVDFNTGEVCVSFRNSRGRFTRKTFVSRPDNAVFITFTSDKAKINTTLDLALVRTFDELRKKKFALDDDLGIKQSSTEITPEWLTIRVWYKNPWKGGYEGYEGAIRVVREGGASEVVDGRLVIRNARSLTLIGQVEPIKDLSSENSLNIRKERLGRLSADYASRLAEHAKIQRELMSRVSLNLYGDRDTRSLPSEELLAKGYDNPAVIETLFDAARYHIISATGVNPPNLQGIWGATMTPAWSGDYTTNGNLPTAVSHYLDASTPELMLPLFDKMEALMDDFRTNARVLFNCRGIHIPSHICLHGYDNQFDATWPMTFWTAGAAWYAMFYYDYYLYTLDYDFLIHRALPFMEEAALFYEDFLTEGADGKYVFNPSYSPENHPGNSKSQACINATMDVMAAKSLLRNLIAVSKVVAADPGKVETWKTMLDKMPPYQINEDGELREWMWKDLSDNHKHRHTSHLLGLFYLHDPEIMASPELAEGCRRVLRQRLDYRKTHSDGGVMAFGVSQLAFPAIALGETEMAHELLTYAGENYWNNNLMTTHDPHEIFNADMSGAYPAMVLKMLAYSEPGVVSLLPACPWERGQLKGRSLRGGILMKELTWDNDTFTVTFHSPVEQTVRLEFRGKFVKDLLLPANEDLTLTL